MVSQIGGALAGSVLEADGDETKVIGALAEDYVCKKASKGH